MILIMYFMERELDAYIDKVDSDRANFVYLLLYILYIFVYKKRGQ